MSGNPLSLNLSKLNTTHAQPGRCAQAAHQSDPQPSSRTISRAPKPAPGGRTARTAARNAKSGRCSLLVEEGGMVSMDTVRIVCSAVCVAEKPGGCLYLLPAPPAVHIAMDRPAGQRVQPVSKQRNRGTTPAFAARQAFCQPPRGCLGRDFHTQSGPPRELASLNTIDLREQAGALGPPRAPAREVSSPPKAARRVKKHKQLRTALARGAGPVRARVPGRCSGDVDAPRVSRRRGLRRWHRLRAGHGGGGGVGGRWW